MLRAVASTLKQKVRPTDVIGRVGGEEFCVLLGAPDGRAAQWLAERLCVTIRELSIALPENSVISATISIGVATARPAPGDLGALLAAADRALYRAKHEGRDRCVLADWQESATMASPRV